MILNTVDAEGVSIVLSAPPEDDMTEKLFEKLGIKIPGNEIVDSLFVGK